MTPVWVTLSELSTVIVYVMRSPGNTAPPRSETFVTTSGTAVSLTSHVKDTVSDRTGLPLSATVTSTA